MRQFLSLLFLLGVWVPGEGSAQILNTLVGFEHEPGWMGKVAASFGAKGGNSEVVSLRASGVVQWQGEYNRWRLIGSGNRTRSGTEDLAESVIGHLRHNYRLEDWVSTLAFGQLQRNPFQRLDSRSLLGAGLRFDLLRGKANRVGLGISHMLERERLRDIGETETVQRLSTFVDLGVRIRPGVEIAAAGFLQPSWSDLLDVRAHLLSELDVELVGSLSLTIALTLSHDSEPPPDVRHTDWSVDTGLSYEL